MTPESRRERALVVFRTVERVMADPVADVVSDSGYSRSHLNRLLSSSTGESIKPFTLRIRLEQAGWRLLNERTSATEIGHEAGFADLEAFIKAFRLAHGISPGRFRISEAGHWQLPSRYGVHWSPSDRLSLPGPDMCTVTNRLAFRVVARKIVGDYCDIPSAWQRLASTLPASLLEQPSLSLFHDDGMRRHERNQMRAHLGFLVSDRCLPPGFEPIEIPGGVYVSSDETASASEHRSLWQSLNADWVSKRPQYKSFQPGFDEYPSVPHRWDQVKARIWLGVVR
jgi:AraC-like DNA-binding protein/predicted transcriptional regulator YdeE